MTIATWPAELPKPERATWSSLLQEARLRRASDAGPAGYRRRFSNVAKVVTLSVLLDADQRARFDNFFEHDTKKGSLLFRMPDPTTDGWALRTSGGSLLLTSDDQPMLIAAMWLCTFGDQLPTETIVGIDFRKTFTVEVMP
ncbi:hypothetical protein [Rhizobium straminoryzae]|uniref:Uncharacterized protein n=1 Tax=Rhizobium straminoryzae TaxID=1387186 RepID=A0A549T837_9HYPH|nr:hypothetical protein [Rhizobium straminoryzae]TRL38039.1 hypothetical protein FNA46_13600 [Rhizobium straminoryzae]